MAGANLFVAGDHWLLGAALVYKEGRKCKCKCKCRDGDIMPSAALVAY